MTADGKKEEFVNENHSLLDLELFTPLLKLVERQGDIKEKVRTCTCTNYIYIILKNILTCTVHVEMHVHMLCAFKVDYLHVR